MCTIDKVKADNIKVKKIKADQSADTKVIKHIYEQDSHLDVRIFGG